MNHMYKGDEVFGGDEVFFRAPGGIETTPRGLSASTPSLETPLSSLVSLALVHSAPSRRWTRPGAVTGVPEVRNKHAENVAPERVDTA